MNDLHLHHHHHHLHLHKPLLSPSASSSSSPSPSPSSSPSRNCYSVATKLSNENLSSFFQRVDAITCSADPLREALHSLQQEQANQSLKNSKALSNKMDLDMEETLARARSIKLSLDALDQDNVENRKLAGCHEGSSVDRVRVFVTNSLRQNLRGFMADFSALQKTMKEDHRDDIRRRLFALTGQIASEGVVDQMMETGESEGFLRKAIEEQGKGGQQNYASTVHQIQERHASVKKLEESLLALHQIFLDMSVLVDMQGEELNDIEKNMLESMSFIKIGVEDVIGAGAADTDRRTTHKWVILLLLLLGFLLTIGVTVLVVVLLVQN